MHGTLMLFFVLTVAPRLRLRQPHPSCTDRRAPHGVSSPQRAWPCGPPPLRSSFSSPHFCVPGGSPIAGWTSYPPLSASSLAGPGEGPGQDLWLAGIALFAIGGTIGAVVTLTTIVKLRCAGMTWTRLPLTVWGWFTAALLAVPAFSVLLAAILLLFCDRHLGSAFFIPHGDVINSTLISHARLRLTASLASSLLVLRSSRGLHRHPPRHGPHLHGHRQLRAPPRLRLPPHDRDHARHRPARHPRLGTSHVRRRPQSIRRNRLRRCLARHRCSRHRKSPQLDRDRLALAPIPHHTHALRARVRLAVHLRRPHRHHRRAAHPRRVPAQHLLRRRPLPPHHGHGRRLRPLLRDLLLVPSARPRSYRTLACFPSAWAAGTSGSHCSSPTQHFCQCTSPAWPANLATTRSSPASTHPHKRSSAAPQIFQLHITGGAFALGLTQLLFLYNIIRTLRSPARAPT